MMMRRSMAALTALVLAADAAQASLIDDEIDILLEVVQEGGQFHDGEVLGVTVGDDVEANFLPDTFNLNHIEVDVSGSDIWISWFTETEPGFAPLNGTLSILDLNWVDKPDGEIVGVIADDDNIGAFTVADVFSDGIVFDYGAIPVDFMPQMDHFTIVTDHDSTPPIPEPATMTLLGLGLGGLAYRRRNHSDSGLT